MGFCTNQVKKLCCFQYVTVMVRPFGSRNSSTAPLTAPSCLVPSLQRLQSLSGLWPTERTYIKVNDFYIILKSSSKKCSSYFFCWNIDLKLACPESESKVAKVQPRYSQPRPAGHKQIAPQVRTCNHGLPRFRQVQPMASMPQDPPLLRRSHALHLGRQSQVILSSSFGQPGLSTFGKTLWC